MNRKLIVMVGMVVTKDINSGSVTSYLQSLEMSVNVCAYTTYK